MRALVSGGNGFIGSHLVDELVKRDCDVTVFDLHERRYDSLPSQVHFVRGDLNQAYLVREAVTGVDVVFHLIWTTIHEVANQDPAEDVRANLFRLFNCSKPAGMPGFTGSCLLRRVARSTDSLTRGRFPRRTHKIRSTAMASPSWPSRNTSICLDTCTALTMPFFGPRFRMDLGKAAAVVFEADATRLQY
jgi:NAD dependent epimerase/dehydratase family